MIVHNWSIACSRYIQDRGRGFLSLIDVRESIEINPEDTSFSLEVVSSWRARPLQAQRFRFRVHVLRDSELILESGELNLSIGAGGRAFSAVTMNAESSTPGDYTIEVSYYAASRWKTGARLPLFIRSRSDGPEATPKPPSPRNRSKKARK